MARAAGGGRKPGKSSLPIAPNHEALTSIDPPEELRDDYAISIWNTQSKILIERKLLRLDHAPILLAYCNSFSLYLEAEAAISEGGLTVDTPMGGLKKNPAVNVRQDALASMVRTGSMLGLDPLSASRLTSGNAGNKDRDNEFAEFAQ